jgi:hypothetical protein
MFENNNSKLRKPNEPMTVEDLIAALNEKLVISINAIKQLDQI